MNRADTISHYQVLKTLYDSGLINRHQLKSIKGQIRNMTTDDREMYLKKIIKRQVV